VPGVDCKGIRGRQLDQTREDPADQKKFGEAIQAFKNGLQEIGLTDSDLKSSVFPIVVPEDFGSFSAFIGLGECLLETGDMIESSKILHRAARLKANSHRPFLGFGKLFLRTNDLAQAEEALLTASKMNEEAETCHLLGLLYEKKGHRERAFDYYVQAFKSAAKESENALSLYQLGKALNKWKEMKGIFEACPESHQEASSAGQYLSDINRHLEDPRDADRPERNPPEGREEFEPISNHSLLIGDAP